MTYFDPRSFNRCLALAILLLATAAQAGEAPKTLEPSGDDLAIEGDTRIAKGVWRVDDANGDGVLRITKDGVVLDLRQAALVGAAPDATPDTYTGIGIHVIGARNVTIRGGSVRGFKIGIRAERAPGLKVMGVDLSENFRQRLKSTPEREDPSDWLWPHNNDKGEWEKNYGAGISLNDCAAAVVSRCTVRDGQNGLLLTRCERCFVHDNDFSFNSGWGIALYRTNRCSVAHNSCDWCVRGYSHGVYYRGQDSAGILVFEQCSHNVFVKNSATHGGDGFFLYAGHETTQRTGKGGCNHNAVFDNDFSHAVANGIEATFSVGNLFVRNDCSDCDHGVWAGYSSDTLIAGCKIDDCQTAGISIEHGQVNRILANAITGAPVGIHLWWDLDEAFVKGPFGQARDTSSSSNLIQGNTVRRCKTAVRLTKDTAATITWNDLHAAEALLDLGTGTKPGTVQNNLFRGARSHSVPRPIPVRLRGDAALPLLSENMRHGHLRWMEGTSWDPSALPTAPALLRPRLPLPDTPNVLGTRETRLPAGTPRGREEMRIGTWGPLDPRLPAVVPEKIDAAGAGAKVHLMGRGPYLVTTVEGDVDVSPRGGVLPAVLQIRALPATSERSAIVPFRIGIQAGPMPLEVSGTLLDARWDVRWYVWKTDPRKDAAAFAALLAGEPRKRVALDRIAFPWQGGGPQGVENDRFATLATTQVRVAGGRYRIRTVSDDGIRVFVDGKRVIDNWTHHAPTEDVAEVDLESGIHDIRIEHFELSGWAQLSFRIERVLP